jgi:hypothetical protein
MGSLSSALFNPAVVGTLHSLTQEGAASLLVRDGLQNYGIVDESKKENKELGSEISMIMWGSWVIWGGGSFLLKSMYFNMLKPFLPFAKNADNSILNVKKGTQQLTKDKAHAYAKVLETRFAGNASLSKQAQALAKDYTQVTSKDAQTFMKQMNWAKFVGILFAGGIPAFLTGWALPKLAQAHSKKKLTKKAKELHAEEAKRKAMMEYSTPGQEDSPKSLALQWKQAGLSKQQRLAPVTKAEAKQKIVQERLGRSPETVMPRSAFANAVNYLNENPNMTNLLLVDSAVTGSRVLTAEDNNDKIRWATYEAIFLYMMYLGSGQVRDMIQQGVMELPGIRQHAQLKGLNFNSLAVLHNYAKAGKDGKDMKQAFNKALKDFGISEAQLKEMQVAFRTYTVHHYLMDKEEKEAAQAKLSTLMEPIVGSISEKMQTSKTAYKPQDNVIVDMLMSENVMPVHQEGFFSALEHGRLFNPQVLGIDLTQAMPAFDEGHGEKGVANVIYRLSQLAKTDAKDIGHRVKASYFGHSMGIFASLGAGFLVMGRLSPLVQSWLSHKVTGQNLPSRLDINNYPVEDEPVVHKYKPTVLDAHV